MTNILDTLFNSYIAVPTLTEEVERNLISEALEGNETAIETLLFTYAPVLKSAIKKAPWSADKEDVQSAVLLGFLEALKAFDPSKHKRLAGVIKKLVLAETSKIGQDAMGFHVPERTLSRFFNLLRQADGNIYYALSLAPEQSMSAEVFISILTALRQIGSIDKALSDGDVEAAWKLVDGPLVATEPIAETDLELIRIIFEDRGDNLDFTERELKVVHTAYGFLDYDDQVKPDAEVGEILDLTRSTVQRTRTSALIKARNRLGLAA
ncbi:hypothetical protein ACFY5D_16600 [Paeniglutamicibacter sp. NPDC012692]|uniref:hypothetical protein n=1 Tax=Paeniglutamicibacter sp. NPDC012692 TaxID=3364388 RepID=UPI003678FF85